MKEFKYKELTFNIIGCAMEVHKVLGPGFLESVYEAALIIELKQAGIDVQTQVEFPLNYKGTIIKKFVCDLLVDKKVILELKAIKRITDIDKAQIINYLKVTELEVGLLFNFGSKSLQYERFAN